MFSLIGTLVVGLAAGWIASRYLGAAPRADVVAMLVVGVAGSFVGTFLFWMVGFKKIVFPASLIPAVVGAMLCVWAIRQWGSRL